MNFQKRMVFIFHFKGDRDEVDQFIEDFSDVLIPKVLGANDNDACINSTDTDYVIRQIREKYLKDSTVTISLLGSCTHSRRYVDWEIKSSLNRGEGLPNGLIGIVLPSQNNVTHLPERLRANWHKGHNDCHARYGSYPSTQEQLAHWIEDAYQARTVRADLIDNSLPMMKYNSKCKMYRETH